MRFSVIQIDESTRLTDFEHYYNLTKEEEQTVLGLCALFNPKVMTELSLFSVDSDLVPEGEHNKFFQITDDWIGVHVNSEVVIGGRVIKVLEIMTFTRKWIKTFFDEPVEAYSSPQLLPPSDYTTNNYNRNSNYSNYGNYNYNNDRGCCEGCKKTLAYLLIFVLIIIIIVSILS